MNNTFMEVDFLLPFKASNLAIPWVEKQTFFTCDMETKRLEPTKNLTEKEDHLVEKTWNL